MFIPPALCFRWSALCIALILCGCKAVGPDYKAPSLSKAEIPARWTSPADTPQGQPTPAAQWWSELADPALNRLIEEAFSNSPTLEAALARLDESRALHAQARGSATPEVGSNAGGQREGGSRSAPSNSGWFSLSSSWELDLFGAVRRGNEGAAAREEAQLATLADARVSLAADIADAYLSYRACQSQVGLSEQDLASREASRKLTADSVEVGFTAPYQAIRSSASVADAKTRLTDTQAQCQQLENLITRLSGIPRPGLARLLAQAPTGLNRLPAPRRFDIAIPAQAVMQRPDVRAAERSLAAASADIGLAEANRYPRIALNGALGYSSSGSNASGGYLSFGSWSFGPSLSLPIFDGGRRAAAVKSAESRYTEALAAYKSKAREAIQEIENALTVYAATLERTENARTAARQYEQFFSIVENRYREGASNLLELEDARRTRLDAQQTLLNVQKERLQAWIALNRATGGAANYSPAGAPEPASQNSAPAPRQAS